MQINEKLFIVIGLLLLILHSLIDFDMSFMLIQLIVYIYVAVLQYDEQEKTQKDKIVDYLLIIFLIFIFSLYVMDMTPYNRNYKLEKLKQDYKENSSNIELLEELQDYIKKEPYNLEQTENYERYFNVLYENLDSLNEKELEHRLNFLVDCIENIPFRVPFGFNSAINRANALSKFVTQLEEYKATENSEKNSIIDNAIQRIKQVIIKEYEINLKNMEDYNKHNYREDEIENMKLQILKI